MPAQAAPRVSASHAAPAEASVLRACGEITESGRYRLEGDLIANPGETCLKIRHTRDVARMAYF
jgi:hypothetical protein